MTPEALKLLVVVLARDGGFFDIKANVAARTELGASGYLRIEPHGTQCRLTITPMAAPLWRLAAKSNRWSNRTCVRSSRLTAFAAGDAPSRIWPYAAARNKNRQLRERSHCRLPLFALPVLVYRSVARVRVPQLVPVSSRGRPFLWLACQLRPNRGREREGAGKRMRGVGAFLRCG